MKTIIIANASSLPDENAVLAVYEYMQSGEKPDVVQLKETHEGIEKLYMLEDEKRSAAAWKENIMQKFEKVE